MKSSDYHSNRSMILGVEATPIRPSASFATLTTVDANPPEKLRVVPWSQLKQADQAAILDAMAELLDALGFETMAREVRQETEPERVRRYAALTMKHVPEDRREHLGRIFRSVGLIG